MTQVEVGVRPFISIDWEMLRMVRTITLMRGWEMRVGPDSIIDLAGAFIPRNRAWDKFNHFYMKETDAEDEAPTAGEVALGCQDCAIYNQFIMRPYLVNENTRRGKARVSCHGLNMGFWDRDKRIRPHCVDRLMKSPKIIFDNAEGR